MLQLDEPRVAASPLFLCYETIYFCNSASALCAVGTGSEDRGVVYAVQPKRRQQVVLYPRATNDGHQWQQRATDLRHYLYRFGHAIHMAAFGYSAHALEDRLYRLSARHDGTDSTHHFALPRACQERLGASHRGHSALLGNPNAVCAQSILADCGVSCRWALHICPLTAKGLGEPLHADARCVLGNRERSALKEQNLVARRMRSRIFFE